MQNESEKLIGAGTEENIFSFFAEDPMVRKYVYLLFFSACGLFFIFFFCLCAAAIYSIALVLIFYPRRVDLIRSENIKRMKEDAPVVLVHAFEYSWVRGVKLTPLQIKKGSVHELAAYPPHGNPRNWK